jgi:hypothetical protein
LIILTRREQGRLHSASDVLRHLKETILLRLHSASDFLRRHKKTIALIVTVAAITLLVSAAISIMLDGNSIISLPSVGYIHTVGVKAYWDPTLQNQTAQINWGTVYAGSSYNVTLYLQSTSNVPTTLSLTSTNWTYINANNTVAAGPSDSTPYMNLTSNYQDQTLNPGQTFQTTLTLTTDNSPGFLTYLINNSITQFSMDITIQANEK